MFTHPLFFHPNVFRKTQGVVLCPSCKITVDVGFDVDVDVDVCVDFGFVVVEVDFTKGEEVDDIVTEGRSQPKNLTRKIHFFVYIYIIYVCRSLVSKICC